MRQTYRQTIKKLAVDQRFRNHPKNKSRARRADKKVKTIAGRLVRELERNLSPESPHRERLQLFTKILAQTKTSKNKIYSIHEPEVQCIGKGKAHKKYEYGNKASFCVTTTGVIVGALSFRNEFDGHTIGPALEQVNMLVGKFPKTVTADRGYRGTLSYKSTEIRTPKPFNSKKQSIYQQRKLKQAFLKRAGIEPIIGHIKADYRLGSNFYKGISGDSINILLAAAAFNFKRMINKWKSSLFGLFEKINIEIICSINQKSQINFALI